jgi:hypothetical protein
MSGDHLEYLTRAAAGVLVTINWEGDEYDRRLRVAAVANEPTTVVFEQFVEFLAPRRLECSEQLYDAVMSVSRQVAEEVTRLRRRKTPSREAGR